MTTPAVRLDEVTHLVAHLEFGDSGVGGWPADGELALSVGPGESWRGRLSVTAMDTAELVWARRASAQGLSEEEARTVLRAAVDCDAAFYGLIVDWDHARIEVQGTVARVAARVWSLPERLVRVTDRRARVIVELVDMRAMYAVWEVTDPTGRLVEQRELGSADLDGSGIESLWDRARATWTSMAASLGWSAAESLNLRLSVSTWESGSCGELEVSAAVR
jgi:hypothetical protein